MRTGPTMAAMGMQRVEQPGNSQGAYLPSDLACNASCQLWRMLYLTAARSCGQEACLTCHIHLLS